MAESSLLNQIIAANKSYLSGTPSFLDPAGEPFVVITCIDSRLTGFIEPALGLPRRRAIVIRTAGNQVSEKNSDLLRSLAVALYVKNAREIVIVGHTDCGLSSFSVSEVTENFRKAGIPRTAFGHEDLRSWFGAFADIRANVVRSIEYLRKSALAPPSVKAHGLILDTESGTLQVVVDGESVWEATPSTIEAILPQEKPPLPEEEKEEPAEAMDAADSRPAKPEPRPKGPVIIQKPEPQSEPPDSLLEATLVLHDFLQQQRHDKSVQKAITDLRTIWRQQKSPYHFLFELQKIGRAYQDRYPNLPGAMLYLEHAVKSGTAVRVGFGEIVRRILD